MLRARILSALLMAPPALLAVYYGTPFFEAMIVAAAAIMAWEWSRLCSGRFGPPGVTLAATGMAAAMLGPSLPVPALVIVAAAAAGLFGVGRGRITNAPWQAAGAIYIGLPVIAITWLRAEAGMATTFWMLFIVWATDIGAYAAGRSLGGPLLAPRVSPKKTWSGLLGGMVAAGMVGAVSALVTGGPIAALSLGSAGLAIVAQAGDLAESFVKRHFGVKDASALIPGHGGLLDRVDGILAVAPVVALLHLLAGEVVVWR